MNKGLKSISSNKVSCIEKRIAIIRNASRDWISYELDSPDKRKWSQMIFRHQLHQWLMMCETGESISSLSSDSLNMVHFVSKVSFV